MSETPDEANTRLLTEIRDALRNHGERLTAVEELAKKTAEAVTGSTDSVTDLSRRVTHMTEQHGTLRQTFEQHTAHIAGRLEAIDAGHQRMAEQLATAVGASKVLA